MGETSVTFGARPFTDACGYGLLRIYLCSGVGFPECCIPPGHQYFRFIFENGKPPCNSLQQTYIGFEAI